MVPDILFRSLTTSLAAIFICCLGSFLEARAELVGPERGPVAPATLSTAFNPAATARVAAEALGDGSDPVPVRGAAPPLQLDFRGLEMLCRNCSPSEVTGDVGATYYVQAVNGTDIAVFTKDGLRLPGYPRPLKALWAGHPGNCDQSWSDNPVVIHDDLADRWLLAQQFEAGGNGVCLAVSTTDDPNRTYHLYEFSTGAEPPEHFRIGAWSNAYFMASRESSNAAYAFSRADLLAGRPTSFIRFSGETNFLMPADVEGEESPGPDAAGLFYTFKSKTFHGGADRLELFAFRPDFADPPRSTFRKIETIAITPFSYTACGPFRRNCIPQKGTTQRIDARSEWPSSRLAYRRFADGRQALAGTFTVHGASPGADTAAVRWFELRNPGSRWSLEQEGTIDADDGTSRFNGSIAMDQAGNLALGYSVSGAAMFPAIRYAVRFRSPANLGRMTPERTLVQGAGAQTGTNRWGGSMMSVDAESGAFWFTSQYYPATSPNP